MYEFIDYQVRDVMTSEPITVKQDITFVEMEAIFEEHDFNGVPVVDRENRLVGMVSKLDLLKAFAFTKRIKIPQYDVIMRQHVSEIMVRNPIVFNPETPLTRVLQKMIDTKHKSFPVVEDNVVVGIVAREDILRALRQSAYGQLPWRLCMSEVDGLFNARDVWDGIKI